MENNISTVKSLLSSLEIKEEGILPSDFVKNLSENSDIITSGILQDKIKPASPYILQSKCSMLSTISFPKNDVTEASLHVSRKTDNKWRKLQDLTIENNAIDLYMPLSRLKDYNFAINTDVKTSSFANFTYFCIPNSVSEKESILNTENLITIIDQVFLDEFETSLKTSCYLSIDENEICVSSVTNTDAEKLNVYIRTRYPFQTEWELLKVYTPDEKGIFNVNLPTKAYHINFKFELILKNNTTISYTNTRPENFPENYKDIMEYLA